MTTTESLTMHKAHGGTDQTWSSCMPCMRARRVATTARPATGIRRVGKYGTCNPADCGPDCQGDCSYDSQRRRRPDHREMWREHTAEELGW